MTQLTFIDLFCGVGGFHQALSRLNHKCVLACDIDKSCCEVYEKNYGLEPVSDVKTIDEKNMPNFDIICAGFPCQPFSIAGKKENFDDPRGLLFDEIIRIAKYNQPKFMFLENVKHILKVGNGKVLEHIKTQIKKIGYTLQIKKISPHLYGIPQQRDRIYFICVRNDLYNNKDIEFPVYNGPIKFNNIFEDVNTIDKKYFINDEIIKCLEAWDEMVKNFKVGEIVTPTIIIKDYYFYKDYSKEQIDKLVENKTIKDWHGKFILKNRELLEKYKDVFDDWYEKNNEILNKKNVYGKLEWSAGPIKENDSIFNYFIQLRQSGIRVKKENFFPTLLAISNTPIYAKEKRYITPRECARLQSFPDNFILHENDRQSYKQMGNSVNVDNVFTVINSTLEHYKTPLPPLPTRKPRKTRSQSEYTINPKTNKKVLKSGKIGRNL